MKNSKWLLVSILFLSSCSNNMFQVEESSFDVLEEEFAADTNSENILHTQEDSINGSYIRPDTFQVSDNKK